MKIKVGCDDLGEDVARVKAVRELIGPGIAFPYMVDANYSMSLDKTVPESRSHLFRYAGAGLASCLSPTVFQQVSDSGQPRFDSTW